MKILKITILLILAVILNCATQGNTEVTSAQGKSSIPNGSTIASNSVKLFDSSSTLIGYASNVTPWLMYITFSNGYMSSLDFGGNLAPNTFDLFYQSANCTGTPYLRTNVNYIQRFILKSSNGLYYRPKNSVASGLALQTTSNLASQFSSSTGTCLNSGTSPVYTAQSSQTVIEVEQIDPTTLGIQTSYSTPLSIQNN